MVDERTLWELLEFVAQQRLHAQRNIIILDDYWAGAEEMAERIEKRIRGQLPNRNAARCPHCGRFFYDLDQHNARGAQSRRRLRSRNMIRNEWDALEPGEIVEECIAKTPWMVEKVEPGECGRKITFRSLYPRVLEGYPTEVTLVVPEFVGYIFRKAEVAYVP